MIHDFRFACRQLIKAPGFAIAAILVLALGIGANTAVFSLVHTMLFAPPGYAQPHELVQVFSQDKKNPKSFRAFSYPTLTDIRAQNSVFSGVAAHNVGMVGLGEKGNTRRVFADVVSSDYFAVLGVTPLRGRVFLPEEETPGRDAHVAIVSYSYWARHNLDPSILGSQILINGRSCTVVGILPQTFTGTMMVFSPEVWMPLSAYDSIANNFATEKSKPLASRDGEHLLLIGRFKPGMAAMTAEAALKTLAANLEKAFPVEQKDQTFTTAPVSRFSISDDPPDDSEMAAIAPLLMGMAAIVLLVACLNLANMLLARGTARRKEIALRLALGGSRWRIVRQLLTEGLLLALLGGVGGLMLGVWCSGLLARSLTSLMPLDVVWNGGPSLPVLAVTFGFCLLGTVCFALGPAMKLSRSSVIEDLKEHAGEDVVRRRWRFLPRNPLVGCTNRILTRFAHRRSAVHSRCQQGGQVRDGFARRKGFIGRSRCELVGCASITGSADISRAEQSPGYASGSAARQYFGNRTFWNVVARQGNSARRRTRGAKRQTVERGRRSGL